MTVCSEETLEFPALKTGSTKRKIEFQFSGGEVTSDGGVLLLRDIDQKLNLTKEFSKHIPDSRNPAFIQHSTLEMVRQRVFGLCLGYEDLKYIIEPSRWLGFAFYNRMVYRLDSWQVNPQLAV